MDSRSLERDLERRIESIVLRTLMRNPLPLRDDAFAHECRYLAQEIDAWISNSQLMKSVGSDQPPPNINIALQVLAFRNPHGIALRSLEFTIFVRSDTARAIQHALYDAATAAEASGSYDRGRRFLDWTVDDESQTLTIGDSFVGRLPAIALHTQHASLLIALKARSAATGKCCSWSELIQYASHVYGLSAKNGAGVRRASAASAADAGLRETRKKRTRGNFPATTKGARSVLAKVKHSPAGESWYEYWIHDAKGGIRLGHPGAG